MTTPRILLGQLVSNGDCLFATAVARQIKQDYPGCHLTWAISSRCRAVLDGNPHVDATWEIPMASNARPEVEAAWRTFKEEAHARQARGEFDEVFLTQIYPDGLHRYDGMVRSTILRGYPHPITAPLAPVLRLSDDEIANVRAFAARHGLHASRQVVLLECGPQTAQASMSPAYGLELARELVARLPAVCVVLSSNTTLDTGDPRLVDASTLTFRENAELTRHCTLLVGCSSGITWLSTSEAARPLPMIQLLNRRAPWFNSPRIDFEHWGLPTNGIIEIDDRHRDRLLPCVLATLTEGFAPARAKFHERLRRQFYVVGLVQYELARNGRFREAWDMFLLNVKSHGLHPGLLFRQVGWMALAAWRFLHLYFPGWRSDFS